MTPLPSVPLPIKVTPWSFSSLNDFETCPRRFYLVRIAKVVREGQSAAMVEGNAVHKAMELFVRDGIPLPETYAKYHKLATMVRNSQGVKFTEYSFGLTRALTPTQFFAKDVWVRGKLDVVILRETEGFVFDYKNGKRKAEYDQLKLFTGAAFRSFPQLQKVRTGYIWLQADKLDAETYTRDDDATIWQEFAIRVHRMEEAARTGDFPARPSGLCRKHCPVGKSLCDHCGE